MRRPELVRNCAIGGNERSEKEQKKTQCKEAEGDASFLLVRHAAALVGREVPKTTRETEAVVVGKEQRHPPRRRESPAVGG
jgi:hypothetical protein